MSLIDWLFVTIHALNRLCVEKATKPHQTKAQPNKAKDLQQVEVIEAVKRKPVPRDPDVETTKNKEMIHDAHLAMLFLGEMDQECQKVTVNSNCMLCKNLSGVPSAKERLTICRRHTMAS